VLYDMALEITSQHQVSRVIRTLLENAVSLLSAGGATLYRPLQNGSTLEVWDSTWSEVVGRRIVAGDGVAGRVFAMNSPLAVPNYQAWEGRAAAYAEEPLAAVVAVPLQWRGKTLAVLDVFRFREDPTPFTDQDVNLLELYAPQAAIALTNAHLLSEAERSAREHRTLRRITAAIARHLDLPTLLETALDEVLRHDVGMATYTSATSHAGIMLIDERGEALRLAACRSFSPEKLCREETIPVGECLCGLAARHNQVIVAGRGDPRHTFPCDISDNVHIVVPLRKTGNRVVGTLVLSLRAGVEAGEHIVSFMEQIGEQLGVAIENAQLYSATRRHAEQLARLAEAVVEFAGALTLSATLARIIAAGCDLLNADRGAIFLLDRETNMLSCAQAQGLSDDYVALINARYREVPGAKVLERGVTIQVVDAQRDPEARTLHEAAVREGFHTYAVWPMLREGEPFGAQVFYRNEVSPFSENDLWLGQTLAQQAAAIIENARLYEQLQNQLAELRATQERLVQAEKLAAVGQLVSGIAHEVNNPLTAVLGYSELLAREPLTESARYKVERIAAQGRRIANLVANLSRFVSPPPLERETLSINDLVRDTLTLWASELEAENITVDWKLGEALPHLSVDPRQMRTVILNIVANARRAMYAAHGRGTLTVRTEIGPPLPKARDTVLIEFTDDGPGIPDSILGRVFEPFFTTREVGQGTGLGLSVCFGIVREHGGEIRVKSPVRTADGDLVPGTTVTVVLPVVAAGR
jgi:signal transduction histidine kinase